MKKAQNILIAGFGDIGKRVARRLQSSRHYQVKAVIRKTSSLAHHPAFTSRFGVQLVRGDLNDFRSLQKLAGHADTILHFAPPTATGKSDTNTQHLLSALSAKHRFLHHSVDRAPPSRPGMLPRRIVYISTTGVYGNCHGDWIDETRATMPDSARAKRRVDAERRLRKWGRRHSVAITVLRAPGIYAEDRLPLERLRRQTPVLMADEDVFTNHIHAEDLATAVIQAMRQRWPKMYRVFNVVDDSQLRMGDYFDQVADAFELERPPRISRAEAEQRISPILLSFMRESRRIGNARVKRELNLELRYPTIISALGEIHLR